MTSDLAARIEAAEAGEQRELLEEAWEECCRESLSFRRFACTTIPGGDGWTMTGRFIRMIDAGAYESAALMLVPEGRDWSVAMHTLGDETRAAVARILRPNGIGLNTAAPTPALALAAAALRAKENDRGVR